MSGPDDRDDDMDEGDGLDQGLVVQVHPARAPGLDLAALVARCEALAAADPALSFRQLAGRDGDDAADEYVNLVFAMDVDPLQAWPTLRQALFEDPSFAAPMAAAAMAVCTGEHGWDDLRVLRHFDKSIPLDDE